MAQEISRDAFISTFRDTNIAVHFFMPRGWLLDRKISADQVDQLVDDARIILNTLPAGLFACIAWPSFLCVVNATREEVESTLDREISSRGDLARSLWRFAIAEIADQSPSEVLWELEWRSIRSAEAAETKSQGYRIPVRLSGEAAPETLRAAQGRTTRWRQRLWKMLGTRGRTS